MTERFNPQWERLLDDALTKPSGATHLSLLWMLKRRPMVLPEDWCNKCALRALSIREVPFVGTSRRISGYSNGREVAIHPKAKDPLHTLIHEMTHIVLKHTVTATEGKWDEFIADATAYVVMHELKVQDQIFLPAARLLLQSDADFKTPDHEVKRDVFTAARTIIDAGRPKVAV